MFNRRNVVISLVKRIMFSICMVLIFIIGKNIPNPFIDGTFLRREDIYYSPKYFHDFSLFRLGLSPWVAGTIITGLVAKTKKWSQNRKQWTEKILILIIATLQAYTLTSNLDIKLSNRCAGIIVFVSGSILVSWLSNMNSNFGIGGVLILFVGNIILSIISSFNVIFGHYFSNMFVVFLVIFTIMVLISNTLFSKAERRIQIINVSISKRLSQESYMPIKLAPAGSMPLMFGMSFFEVIRNIIQILQKFFLEGKIVQWLLQNLTYTSFFGVSIYMMIVFLLTFVFGYFQVDPYEKSKDLQFDGNFIPGLYPGVDTEKYLRKITVAYSSMYGIYLMLVSGVPLLFSSGSLINVSVLMIPSVGVMLADFIIRIVDEIKVTLLNRQYSKFF
ncbi:hypothetical protein ACIPCB_08985 [Pediococcus pentosaceus]|uniref:hypothetical protein n=1 Tax=Pediococcus pentosaceus TaxID=1255 RepID=UPI001914847A|nr:hypothetical protein [Pediococcus pentosaceus]